MPRHITADPNKGPGSPLRQKLINSFCRSDDRAATRGWSECFPGSCRPLRIPVSAELGSTLRRAISRATASFRELTRRPTSWDRVYCDPMSDAPTAAPLDRRSLARLLGALLGPLSLHPASVGLEVPPKHFPTALADDTAAAAGDWQTSRGLLFGEQDTCQVTDGLDVGGVSLHRRGIVRVTSTCPLAALAGDCVAVWAAELGRLARATCPQARLGGRTRWPSRLSRSDARELSIHEAGWDTRLAIR